MNLPRCPMGARLLSLAFACACHGAPAQTPPSTLADCHRIEAGAERLACYDAVTGRTGAAPAPQSRPAAIAAPTGTSDAMTRAVAKASGSDAATSMIDAAWGFERESPPFDISFYRSNYLLIGRYSNRVNNAPFAPLFEALGEPPDNLNHTEAKFQVSFKSRLWTTDDRRLGAWVGYTQQNHWQVYNGDTSRPFRETDYMPEAFVSYRPDVELPGGFRWGLVNAGFTHQSNGRSDPLSRSWNRLFVEFGAERGSLALSTRLWYRLPENASQDDNPDITDYYGHGEIGALYRWQGNTFSGALRGSLRTGRGSIQLNWFTRPLIGAFRGYVQFFSGYGESLIDYNWRQTTIGAGVALSDGL